MVDVTSAAPHFLRGDWVTRTVEARPARTRIPIAVI